MVEKKNGWIERSKEMNIIIWLGIKVILKKKYILYF